MFKSSVAALQGCRIEGALHMAPRQLQGGANMIVLPADAAACSLPMEEGRFVWSPNPYTRKM